MATLDDILSQFELSRADVTMWIEEGWIEPERKDDTFVFDEADTARVGLILEFKRDLEIDDSAIPVVLSLLDQLHAARAALTRIAAAVAELPPETRDRLTIVLGEHALADSDKSP
jgi:chaperone modulatory protein CbpM